jgi:hypothetical protein
MLNLRSVKGSVEAPIPPLMGSLSRPLSRTPLNKPGKDIRGTWKLRSLFLDLLQFHGLSEFKRQKVFRNLGAVTLL